MQSRGAPERALGERESASRGDLTWNAVFGLASAMPEFSARKVCTGAQAVFLVALVFGLAAAVLIAPGTALRVLVAAMSIGFIATAVSRGLLAWSGSRGTASYESAQLPYEALPNYTVLVPLYHEAKMVRQIHGALSALDYPRDKLQVLFAIEEDDRETCRMAQAAAAMPPFETIVVPPSEPRTKPKACNYALPFARGEYLVIYDAEDRPEPDQLRKAVSRFRRSESRDACLQARLVIDNPRDAWVSRMFALDYAIWFKALLPGLARLAAPIPLGGTSNHFRTSVLREIGGWDPFNVTEDADIGWRLSRFGYRVGMLDSNTFEEAPPKFGPWLRQRSRWLKGYMQTCLVHSRNPIALVRSVGLRGVAVMQSFLGGAIWSALVNPILWIVFLVSSMGPDGDGPHALQSVARISGLGLLMANAALAGLAMADRRRTKGLWCIPYGLSFVFYWALISIAAYRALWQLAFEPFRWEKTPHGADVREAPRAHEPCAAC